MSLRRKAEMTRELIDKEFVPADEKSRCLATALYQTERSNPFYGSVLQCLNIIYSHQLPTAGVTFNAEVKRWDLLINPRYYCRNLDHCVDKNKKKIGDQARKAVLLHELGHITNQHPVRVPFIKIAPDKRRLMNIAADMAINQYIQHLPQGCAQCPPGNIPQKCPNEECPGKAIRVEDFYDEDKAGKKTPWKERMTMEYYYEKLVRRMSEGDGEGSCPVCSGSGKKSDGMPCDCQGHQGTLDEHMWDSSGEEREMLDATEELMKRAMIKASMSYDELDGSIKDLLKDIAARRAELDYRSEILAAIKKSASGHERKHTWTRKSRRFGTKAPGTKVGDLPALHFFMDSSGSISVEEANEFLEIMDNFLRAGSRRCEMNLFHTSIYLSQKYRLGNRIDKNMWQSGGTCLEDTMRKIAEAKPDLAVIITDGYYSDVDVKGWLPPGMSFPQCLFIISRQGDKNHPLQRFGKTIKIPDNENRG